MDEYKCYRCGMIFKVKTPHDARVKETTCAEKPCDTVFWHYARVGANVISIGMYPSEAARLRGEV